MKKLSILLVALVTMVSCDMQLSEPTSTEVMAQRQEKQMKELTRQVGYPAIKNFQEKKIAKQIMELRDKSDLVCYAYLVNLNGKLIYLGKCIGYGLPYSTQFSCPEKLVNNNAYFGENRNDIPIPQAEPNGLYMPEGLSATWLMMLDDKGRPHPVYIEPEIIVSPFKLK